MSANLKLHLTRDFLVILVGIIVAVLLVRIGFVDWIVLLLKDSFILVAFVAGALYSSVFTSVIATAILLVMGKEGYDPVTVGFIGAFGGLAADTILFNFVQNDLRYDLKILDRKIAHGFFSRIVLYKPFHIIARILGLLVIASPLPDELGVALLALEKMDKLQFSLASYALNFVGIFTLVSLGGVF